MATPALGTQFLTHKFPDISYHCMQGNIWVGGREGITSILEFYTCIYHQLTMSFNFDQSAHNQQRDMSLDLAT